MGVQGLFTLVKGIPHVLNVVQGVFNTHSSVHVHSTAFGGCSILTQRCSHALNHIQELFNSYTNVLFFMVTSRWVTSRALNGCSHSLNGINVHSMGVPIHSMAFMCTQWVFRGCSHSLIGIYAHSMDVQGLFKITQRHSRALTSIHGVFNTHSKAFSLFIYLKAQWIYFQICNATKALEICSQFPLNAFSWALSNKKSKKSWCDTWIDDW